MITGMYFRRSGNGLFIGKASINRGVVTGMLLQLDFGGHWNVTSGIQGVVTGISFSKTYVGHWDVTSGIQRELEVLGLTRLETRWGFKRRITRLLYMMFCGVYILV